MKRQINYIPDADRFVGWLDMRIYLVPETSVSDAV